MNVFILTNWIQDVVGGIKSGKLWHNMIAYMHGYGHRVRTVHATIMHTHNDCYIIVTIQYS